MLLLKNNNCPLFYFVFHLGDVSVVKILVGVFLKVTVKENLAPSRACIQSLKGETSTFKYEHR